MKKSVKLIALGMLSVFLIVSYAACKKTTDTPNVKDKTTYTVTPGTKDGGDFSVSPTGPYKAGDKVTLTITDTPANHVFKEWEIVLGNSSISVPVITKVSDTVFTFIMPKSNLMVNLGFEFDSSSGEAVEIVYDDAILNGSLSGTTQQLAGSAVVVTATPDTGYRYLNGSIKVFGGPMGNSNITSTLVIEIERLANDIVTFTFNIPVTQLATYDPMKVSAEFELKPPPGTVYEIYKEGNLFTSGQFQGDVLINPDQLQNFEDDFIQGDPANDMALKFGPRLPSYGGGWAAVFDTETVGSIDFSLVDAIQFMAKANQPMKVGFFNIGTKPNRVTFAGDDSLGVPLTTEWQQFYIPLPKRLDVEVSNAFNFWLPKSSEDEGNIVYIKDIAYIETDVTLKEIVLKEPDPLPKTGNTPITTITAGMKAVYTVKGQDVPIFIENIGASSTDLDTTYLGFLRFHDVSYNYSGTGAKITGSNIESLIPGDNYSFSVTFDLGKASEKTGSVNGEVLDKLYVIIEDCLSKGSVTHDWDGDHPGDLTGPGDGGTNNQGYHGVGWYKAITDHEGVNCIGIMDINYGPAPQWGLNQGTFGRDSALATDDGVKTWNLTGMTKIRFKYLISVPEGGMFQSGSLKLALDDDEYGISFPPFQTFDTWLDAEITISGLTNVTSYFLTFSADPYLIAGKENGVFIYITPIIAWEY